MKIISSLIFFFFVSYNSLFSQLSQQWIQKYNGPINAPDYGEYIALDIQGNIYVTGTSYGSGGNVDVATMKYDQSGALLWVRRYNGPGNGDDQVSALVIDSSGNVYITGYGNGIGTGNDYQTIKYNTNGDLLWVERYNNPGNAADVAHNLSLDILGNVYVTGGSKPGINGRYEYLTLKYTSTGVLLWEKRYSGNSTRDLYGQDVKTDLSLNVYVTGWSSSNSDIITIKYDSLGVQQWIQIYDGPAINFNDDKPSSMSIDHLGNIYIGGFSAGVNPSGYDFLTIKYNSTGSVCWIQRYNGPANTMDIAEFMTIDNLGNVYITGFSNGIGTLEDITTIKYDSSGNQKWIQRYNGSASKTDKAHSIATDNSGNVFVTGEYRPSSLYSDIAVIMYDSLGNQRSFQDYNGTGNSHDVSYSIALDNLGNIYITGYSTGIGTTQDYTTIKYNQIVGVVLTSNEIPKSFSLSQNYPNPFNPQTNINFELPVSDAIKLVVYDMLGREIETLINQVLNAGTYKVGWDASKYSSGVYYYTISAEGFTETKKMILIK